MTITEAESRIKELKTAQSDFFKKKKDDRNAEELDGVRQELNELKEKLHSAYRGKEVEGIEKG